MLYDYLQRHEPSVADFLNQQRYQPLNIAHAAQRVFVTTRFTLAQAIHFAGIPEHQVRLLPMLAPERPSQSWATQPQSKQRYFLWTTNLGSHKNHLNALKALRIYYEELGGQLSCFVTGVDTRSLLKSELLHLKPVADLWAISSALRFHVKLLGELPDLVYQGQLKNSAFLWHPARIDNGTFSVVEAAQVGVPALSSDYPAMREIDAQFGLNLTWMNPHDPLHMARQLQAMALQVEAACARLPSHDHLASQGVVHLAGAYWEAIRECL
jgi:glycosyltransferase involved in cell wall biosynthesis